MSAGEQTDKPDTLPYGLASVAMESKPCKADTPRYATSPNRIST